MSGRPTRFGGGNNHVLKCGKGVGLFMMIRVHDPFANINIPFRQLYEACSGIMISAREKHAMVAFKLVFFWEKFVFPILVKYSEINFIDIGVILHYKMKVYFYICEIVMELPSICNVI